jgi:hypothetical protein
VQALYLGLWYTHIAMEIQDRRVLLYCLVKDFVLNLFGREWL